MDLGPFRFVALPAVWKPTPLPEDHKLPRECKCSPPPRGSNHFVLRSREQKINVEKCRSILRELWAEYPLKLGWKCTGQNPSCEDVLPPRGTGRKSVDELRHNAQLKEAKALMRAKSTMTSDGKAISESVWRDHLFDPIKTSEAHLMTPPRAEAKAGDMVFDDDAKRTVVICRGSIEAPNDRRIFLQKKEELCRSATCKKACNAVHALEGSRVSMESRLTPRDLQLGAWRKMTCACFRS